MQTDHARGKVSGREWARDTEAGKSCCKNYPGGYFHYQFVI